MNNDNKLIVNRLRRIAGQVKGVEKMVEDDRSCKEIVQQLISVKSAVNQACTKILVNESCRLDDRQDGIEFEKLIKNLISLQD